MPRIEEYTALARRLIATDLLDISTDEGAAIFPSRKGTWAQILDNLGDAQTSDTYPASIGFNGVAPDKNNALFASELRLSNNKIITFTGLNDAFIQWDDISQSLFVAADVDNYFRIDKGTAETIAENRVWLGNNELDNFDDGYCEIAKDYAYLGYKFEQLGGADIGVGETLTESAISLIHYINLGLELTFNSTRNKISGKHTIELGHDETRDEIVSNALINYADDVTGRIDFGDNSAAPVSYVKNRLEVIHMNQYITSGNTTYTPAVTVASANNLKFIFDGTKYEIEKIQLNIRADAADNFKVALRDISGSAIAEKTDFVAPNTGYNNIFEIPKGIITQPTVLGILYLQIANTASVTQNLQLFTALIYLKEK
jgi:hypothetical protein